MASGDSVLALAAFAAVCLLKFCKKRGQMQQPQGAAEAMLSQHTGAQSSFVAVVQKGNDQSAGPETVLMASVVTLDQSAVLETTEKMLLASLAPERIAGTSDKVVMGSPANGLEHLCAPQHPLVAAFNVVISSCKPAPLGWISCGMDVLSRKSVSPTWEDLTGLPVQKLQGHGWKSVVHSHDLHRAIEQYQKAHATGTAFSVYVRVKAKNGGYRWLKETGSPFCDNGVVKGYLVLCTDVHEVKCAEEDFNHFVSMPDLLIKIDLEGHINFMSPSMCKLLGVSEEQISSQQFINFVHEDDVPTTTSRWKELLDGQPVTDENRYRCADGKYVWLQWTALPDLANGLVYGIGRDITRLKQTEAALRAFKNDFQQIADMVPAVVYKYKVDAEGKESYPFCSKALERITGLSPSLLNQHPEMAWSAMSPDDVIDLKKKVAQASLTLEPLVHDYKIKNVLTGTSEWLRLHALPQPREEDGSQTWFGVCSSVTDLRRTEEELRKARDAAEKASRNAVLAAQAKGAFLANMSHEIRTPLNAVIGMGSLLLGTQLTDEQRDFVSTIRSSSEALLAIINDILDFSKIDAGKMQLENRPLEVRECIEDSLDLVATQAADKGLELAYGLSPQVPPFVYGDFTRVRQIIMNLLSNAVKFTEEGAVFLTVTSRPVDPQGGEHEIEFCVKDTGIGIPKERQAALFKAFSQVDTSTTRRFQGTGLGLAICARLVKLMDGRIWVESKEGRMGTKFSFTIQFQSAPGPSRESFSEPSPRGTLDFSPPTAPTTPTSPNFVNFRESNAEGDTITERPSTSSITTHVDLSHRRVLLVYGHPTTRGFLLELLKSWNVKVGAVGSTLEASALLSSSTFDAIIVDQPLAISSRSTKGLLESLKAPQKLIMLTAIGKRPDAETGISAFVTKPVKAAQLRAAIANVCGGGEPVDEGVILSPMNGTSRDSRQLWVQPKGGPRLAEEFPLRILIAEDNAVNVKVVLRLLHRLGYTGDMVSVVNNGLEALHMVQQKQYDVVLCDVHMPLMDGLEAATRMRATCKPCPVIVAVTAAVMHEERQQCIRAGMDMYLSKPIQGESLAQALVECYKMKAQIQEALPAG